MDVPTTPGPVTTVAPPPPPPLPSANLHPYNGSHHGISLLHGWLPLTIELVALALLAVAIVRFTPRWWLIRVPICLALGVAAAVASWAYMNNEGLASDPAPLLLWVCIGATAVALAVAVAGWPGARWWRRAAAIVAVPLAAMSTAVVLDQWVGYYPTAQAAWNALTAGPLPHQTDLDALPGMRNTNVTTGVVVPVSIPDDASGFKHRTEYVYLPPAWFAGDTPPALPAVMMVGGEFNTPGDWLRSGQIMPEIDRFSAANGGRAPILVFVDSSGSFNNDTECVNGPRGAAADHLTKDVVPYVESTFGAQRDPANWAVVGWSMGGTCAVDLTVMHPELFHTFVDIAGDLGPTAGTKEQTVQRLYGGDPARWDRFDPLTVMAGHGPYPGVAGLFDDLTPPQRSGARGDHRPQTDDDAAGMHGRDGVADTGEVGAAEKLCAQGRSVGIDCTIHTTRGGHTWQFAAASFTSSFPWVSARVGLPAQANG
ncbi:S-formylglutathione hydrolase FrmB [Nocardia transvalensis]|uniref:S-formylglutathione hydrolase FrmB n=1 Tax=Nocardia transvalensis TaxID=37333 RepID=A0A7W9PGG0_9NOCA|nr:alpha/beta hydrolase-fold protein [Nocardia transvalensis]MBB5915714.1 S-formylglutathione hydrolase FrmB [Nocardia transvalensis]